MIEKSYRSVVKAVSYRIWGTVMTVLVSQLVTGQFKLALSIGIVEFFAKSGLYYVHERIWNKIPFGRVPSGQDYEI